MKRASVVRHFRCGSGDLGALAPGGGGGGGVGVGGMFCFKRVGCGWWLLIGP